MARVILGLVAAALVVAVAWALAGLPGHVSAEVGDYSFDAATPVVALSLLVIFLVIYLVIRLLAALLGVPRAMRGWRGTRRRSQGDAAVTRTLLALAAGDQNDARREAARSRRLLGDTPQTLLLTAEAGRLAGREGEAEAAFRELAARDDAAFLGLRGLMRQAMAREDWPEAAALARRAEAAHPGASWLRSERSVLAVRTGAWSEALALADPDAPTAVLATAAAQAETDPAQARRYAKQAFEQDPSLTPAALAYAARLREAGRETRAQEVIRKAWSINPHPDLAAFALAPVSDKMMRLREAKRLVQENPEHAESHLLLAEASLDAGMTGEARHQIEAARAAGMNQRRLWLLLARIEEEDRGDTEDGRAAQREALRSAAAASPDPVWRCRACGTQLKEWRPVCPNCGTQAQVSWTSLPEMQRLAG